MRHPELRLSFLEGGVTWAAQLFADLLGHYEKRNHDAVQRFDPARFDVAQAGELFAEFATGPLRGYQDRVDEGARPLGDAGAARYGIDDFAESGITGPDDIVDIFTRQLGFGCEADDPLNALAFDDALLPHGARLNAMFASDIGHWDVPDVREVLPEAWELVEDGHLTRSGLRRLHVRQRGADAHRHEPAVLRGHRRRRRRAPVSPHPRLTVSAPKRDGPPVTACHRRPEPRVYGVGAAVVVTEPASPALFAARASFHEERSKPSGTSRSRRSSAGGANSSRNFAVVSRKNSRSGSRPKRTASTLTQNQNRRRVRSTG